MAQLFPTKPEPVDKKAMGQAALNNMQQAQVALARLQGETKLLAAMIGNRIIDGPGRGSQKSAATVAQAARDLRFYLRNWAHCAKLAK
jgi:hypothetical protein